MSLGGGWVSVYRSLFDSPFYNDKPFDRTHAFIDLLMLANHKDTRAYKDGEIVVLKRGTVNRSIASLAERWGWDRKKVRKFLVDLERSETATTTTTTHGTTISLVNYGLYQCCGTTDGTTDGTTTPQPMGQPLPTNNNINNNNSYVSYVNAHAREHPTNRTVRIIDDTKEN